MYITPVNMSVGQPLKNNDPLTGGIDNQGSILLLMNYGRESRMGRNLMEIYQEWKIFNNCSRSSTLFSPFSFLPVSFVITPLFITLSLLIISSSLFNCLVSSSSLEKSLKWPHWSYISNSFLHVNIPTVTMREASWIFCSAFSSISCFIIFSTYTSSSFQVNVWLKKKDCEIG